MHNLLDHPSSPALASVLGSNHHVAQVTVRGIIRNQASHPDLGLAPEKAEIDRVPQTLLDHLPAAIGRPISGMQQVTDRIEVESREVIGKAVISLAPIHTSKCYHKEARMKP